MPGPHHYWTVGGAHFPEVFSRLGTAALSRPSWMANWLIAQRNSLEFGTSVTMGRASGRAAPGSVAVRA